MRFIEDMKKVGIFNINEELGIRNYNYIETKSGYKLSIQCSVHHYCSPREMLDLNEYRAFELAIFKGRSFVYPSILANFSRKKELDECYEGQVFAFVAKDLLQDLYNYLNNTTETME